MPTLILSPRYTDDSIAIRAAAIRRGWRVMRLPNWRAPEGLEVEEATVYGEPLFVAAIAEPLDLVALEPPFDFLTNLPPEYVLREVTFGELASARTIADPKFIKPADDKCFKARVYADPSSLPPVGDIPEWTPVLVAEPVEWELEFRAFIQDRKIVTMSPYLRFGKLSMTDDGEWFATNDEIESATRLVESVVGDHRVDLPPGVVIDVGNIAHRGWAVVEANPAWGSGIYGCDPDRILDILRATIKPRTNLVMNDIRWVPKRQEDHPFKTSDDKV